MSIPKVFISYSHDSLEHKNWVNELGSRLRKNGIDAILDQWELQAGDDLPHFMETHLENSDYIIMICTESYVSKANKGEGGVGYEKMIITSNLMKNINSNKIIPVIRQSESNDIPTFLKSKMYINFSRNDDFEFNFDELIRTIHNSPILKKPKIGNNPFSSGKLPLEEPKNNDSIFELMKTIVWYFENTTSDKIYYRNIVSDMNISRIYLDITIKEAIELGLIFRPLYSDWVELTEKGKQYTIENNLTK